jgi:hypothetical protein
MDKEQLLKEIQTRGLDWIATALLEDSIGYYTPSKAYNLIEDALERGHSGFERTMYLFKGDALEEIERAILIFQRYPKPEQDEKVKQFKAIKDKLHGIEEITFSLMYPTL